MKMEDLPGRRVTPLADGERTRPRPPDATGQCMTQSAFSRHLGVDKAHVTRLKQAGRLVIVDGLVDVEASKRRIEQTAGTRDDVARRHAEGRAGRSDQRGGDSEGVIAAIATAGTTTASQEAPGAEGEAAPPTAADRAPGAASDPSTPPEPVPATAIDAAREQKILAESRRVQAAAAREELELSRARGDVIAREDVDAALKFAGATLRGEIERLADQLAPLVAPVADLEECRATIEQAARDILARFVQACERQAAQLGRPA